MALGIPEKDPALIIEPLDTDRVIELVQDATWLLLPCSSKSYKRSTTATLTTLAKKKMKAATFQGVHENENHSLLNVAKSHKSI